MLRPIYVKEAWEIVSRYRIEPKVKEIPIEEAVYRVLAEDIYADADLPRFNRSAMDGIAIRSDDSRGISVSKREKISTGMPLPPRADAVVPRENYIIKGSEAILDRPYHKRENVDVKGSDVSEGELILRRGSLIKPNHLPALALSRERVKVYTIEFSLIVVGSEIEPFGEVRDLNSPTLKTLISLYGGEVSEIIRVPDDERKIEEAIRKAKGVIVTTGGTSIGERDLVPRVIERLGEVLVHGIKAKPCKPFTFSFIGKPIFSLPGPPVACFIAADVFLGPRIKLNLGLEPERIRERRRGILAKPIASKPDRRDYVRVIYREGKLYPAGSGAGRISTLFKADGYMEIEEDLEGIDAGEEVERLRF